jgi:hypothetical protein
MFKNVIILKWRLYQQNLKRAHPKHNLHSPLRLDYTSIHTQTSLFCYKHQAVTSERWTTNLQPTSEVLCRLKIAAMDK